MPARPRLLASLAAICGFLAVAAGAFATHNEHDPLAKELLRTGADYGLIHALAVFAALFVGTRGGRVAGLAGWLFLVGSAVFSVSLYLLALTDERWLGAVTPLGGLAMLGGWIALARAALTMREI
jgi:uncharacterized membrane protein YgdD (TMEM256/DUF423 family)